MQLTVNDIFYSLQGEGGRAGEASVFIRLTKCNLACSYCDTDFVHGKKMSLEEIELVLKSFSCPWIIWTGGEPSIQLKEEVIRYFSERGYKQAIETNGTRPLPQGLDYIACSPKENFHLVKKVLPRVNELRFPIKKDDLLPDISLLPESDHYLLSPIFDGEEINRENIDYCVEQIKENPAWKLSLQMHKLILIK